MTDSRTTRHDFRGHRLTFVALAAVAGYTVSLAGNGQGMLACTLTRAASERWGAHLAPGYDDERHASFRRDLREWATDIARERGSVQVEIYARPPRGDSGQDWIVDQFDILD